MEFRLLRRNENIPNNARNTVYLHIDEWNDYSFITMFYMNFVDENGEIRHIGNIKIGFRGQTTSISTHAQITQTFSSNHFVCLPADYFSIGTDGEYYSNLQQLPRDIKNDILLALKDLAFNTEAIETIIDEEVFLTSLLRGVRLKTITEQFSRILKGLPALTEFEFKFQKLNNSNESSPLQLDFAVEPSSKPSTNIHAIIGRNGVGKTTILNDMIKAIVSKSETSSRFLTVESHTQELNADYFNGLVSVSFSVFDISEPPQDQSNSALGNVYFYIGLKKYNGSIKQLSDLHDEFADVINLCMMENAKKHRWIRSIRSLESDVNFAQMDLVETLSTQSVENLTISAKNLIRKMSSGHAIVLLIITKLIATVEEKTLVILDEPESHLHPPLLSAFIRALSELLYDRNGVAIIATHSPVVLQEIPRSCVWKIQRVGLSSAALRPEIETFGENVGVLTREVFGLEVTKSGFHKLLSDSVFDGKNRTYDEILGDYNEQLGMEAKVLLRILVTNRDRENAANSAT